MGINLTTERVARDVDVVARAGLDLDSFLAESLASIGRAVPHVASCIATVDPSTLLLNGTHKFGELQGRDEHDHEFGLIEYGVADPTAFVELAHRASPAIAVAAQAPGSFRVREFMNPYFDYDDELRAICRDDGQVWGGFALFRHRGESHFTEDEAAFMARLSPVLSIGIRAALLNTFAASAPSLPASGPAVILVGTDNEVQQVSIGAEERLADLVNSDTQVPATAVVSGLVAAARRFAAGQTSTPPRCRVRGRSGMWLVLHATPMGRRDGSTGDVVVTIDEARPPEIVPLVVAAFDLTPRERDVTERVLQGLDTREIATSMHLSSYTVQDHLKSVFSKADVRSRRELIAKIYFDQYVPRMGTDIGPSGWFATSETGSALGDVLQVPEPRRG